MSRKSQKTTTVILPHGRVVREHIDLVGNNLTASLWWCDTHQEPVWVFNDGSYTCPQERVIKFDDKTHVIVDPPWETS